jgi:hypothetical protein
LALPSVNADRVETAIEGPELVPNGTRALPAEFATPVIHRLELPQGRFERRLRLPDGGYNDICRTSADGCLVVVLRKVEEIACAGSCCPSAGSKEKLAAAARAGLTRALLPARNRKDLEDVSEETRNSLDLAWLERVDDAMEAALEPMAPER